jgi:cytochrome c oxidase cbb3-type subunit III
MAAETQAAPGPSFRKVISDMLRKALFYLLGAICLTPFVLTAQAAPAHAQAPMAFKIYCARCHGDDGKGDGPAASGLSTKPQDFQDCAAMAKKTDANLFKAIKDGGASVGLPADMPAWGMGLNDDQIHQLIAYIRTFCKK